MIIEINQDAVAATGEPFFLRDQALLESALASPQNHWQYGEEDIAVLAVSLLSAIARNHPFVQGNKRTAFTAAMMFLELNGYEFTHEDSTELGMIVESLVEQRLSVREFTDYFASHVRLLDPS